MNNKNNNAIPPGATFYIKMVSWNSDDTMDLNAEAVAGGTKIDDALNPLTEDVEEYGGFGYVYECHPIIKVMRPGLKIIDLRKNRKEGKP